MSGLKAWSFSRWRRYDTCPHQAFLAYIKKLEEQQGPALVRGQKIHEDLETYLKGGSSRIPPEGLNLKRELMSLKKAPGLRVEDQWAFRFDLKPCDWFDRHCWLRAKVDARYGLRESGLLTIVDFKTGCKPPRQPGKYDDLQKEIYAACAAAKFGDALLEVDVEYWYLDRPVDDNIYRETFNKHQLADRLEYWTEVGRELTSRPADEPWEKTPGLHCRWCSFHTNKGGPCDGGSEEEEADDGSF